MADDDVNKIEDAFLKRLKGLSMYADVFSTAAASIDAGRDTPESSNKMLHSFVPGLDAGGIEAFLRNMGGAAQELSKAKGAQVHPAVKYCADEFGKLSDDDYKNLSKPLRLIAQATAKAKLPAPGPKRAWVGDSPKRF